MTPPRYIEQSEITRLPVEDVVKIPALRKLLQTVKHTPAYFCSIKRQLTNRWFFFSQSRQPCRFFVEANKIETPDVQRVYELFIDLGRSVQFLEEYQSRFVFHS